MSIHSIKTLAQSLPMLIFGLCVTLMASAFILLGLIVALVVERGFSDAAEAEGEVARFVANRSADERPDIYRVVVSYEVDGTQGEFKSKSSYRKSAIDVGDVVIVQLADSGDARIKGEGLTEVIVVLGVMLCVSLILMMLFLVKLVRRINTKAAGALPADS